jgi:hypothetical protein
MLVNSQDCLIVVKTQYREIGAPYDIMVSSSDILQIYPIHYQQHIYSSLYNCLKTWFQSLHMYPKYFNYLLVLHRV